MSKLRVVIASPGDLQHERSAAEKIVREVAGGEPTIDLVEVFRWEKDVPPGFSREPVQIGLIDPRARIFDCDIVIVLFKHRLGSPVAPGNPTGTEHEFQTAFMSWRATGRPQIMVYFSDAPFSAASTQEAEQYAALSRFRFSFPSDGIYGTFHDTEDLHTKLRDHIRKVLKDVTELVKNPFSVEDFEARVEDVDPQGYTSMLITGSQRLYSSFNADNPIKPFLRLKVPTTVGHIPNPKYPERSNDRRSQKERWKKKTHRIYLLRDPVRPFEIQIGDYRARRFGREAREVPFEGVPDYRELHKLYPLIRNEEHRWLRFVFAELLNDERALAYIAENEVEDEAIRKVIARNPSAPAELKERECIFCDVAFQAERKISHFDGDAHIIANDFPFGPYFHYIVFPDEPIHSWDKVEERHLYAMNFIAYQHLKEQYKLNRLSGTSGLRIGLNSSVRHLVLGRRTRTSAGASVTHVHKQIWGMAPYSVNLADHLRSICLAYETQNPLNDYLGGYCEALRSTGLAIWEDKHVLLYVPFGQIAVHELQIMVKEAGRRTFLDLTEPEIKSLSRAEWIVTQLYSKLDINSFNEILLSLPFDDRESKKFRLIFTFITREVDLAVSELSLLYVVDQHPSHTVVEINRVWPSRDPAALKQS